MPASPPRPGPKPSAAPAKPGAKAGAKSPSSSTAPAREIPVGTVVLVVAVVLGGLGFYARSRMTAVDKALTEWAAQPVPSGHDAFDVAKAVRNVVMTNGGVVGQDAFSITVNAAEGPQTVAVSARYRVAVLGLKMNLDTQVNATGENLVVTSYQGDGVIPLPPDPNIQARLTKVLAAEKCPAGTVEKGFAPPQGHETWCEKPGAPGKQHGPYRGWHPNGSLAEEGQYQDGSREGKWTRYHPNGNKAAEAFYRANVQHGRARRWDAGGTLQEDVEFRNGMPTR